MCISSVPLPWLLERIRVDTWIDSLFGNGVFKWDDAYQSGTDFLIYFSMSIVRCQFFTCRKSVERTSHIHIYFSMSMVRMSIFYLLVISGRALEAKFMKETTRFPVSSHLGYLRKRMGLTKLFSRLHLLFQLERISRHSERYMSPRSRVHLPLGGFAYRDCIRL